MLGDALRDILDGEARLELAHVTANARSLLTDLDQHGADLVILCKTDLLPHVDFDVAEAHAFARRVNPDVQWIELSAKTGQGLGAWIAWLERGVTAARERAMETA